MAGSRITKLAVVGGGSSYTPELIEGLIQHENDLPIDEIVLFDIDADKVLDGRQEDTSQVLHMQRV